MISRLAVCLLALAACSKDSGSAGAGSAVATTAPAGSAAAKKSSGFSASLSAEMAKEGSAAPSVAAPSTAPSAAGSAAAAGSAKTVAVADTKPGDAKSGDTKPADTKPGDTKLGDTKPAGTKPADTNTKPADTKPADTKPADAKPAAGVAGGVAERPGDHYVHVQPPAELAAIKMDLEPNWDRDYGDAGTISFVLKVPNTNDTRLFSFHYGYDPAGAPSDRDAYMKWLADQKLLDVTLNRQRGAAWYLEGTDGSGAPAFRYLVLYGGKHLVCWGHLYKDAASNPLGDLRDKVVMAAKKICETMTL